MMSIRIVCVFAAVIVASTSLWLALALMVGGAVLPWCAVLIANDRPPQRSTAFVRYRPNGAGALGASPGTPAQGSGSGAPAPEAARAVYVLDAAATTPAAGANGRTTPR